MNYKLLLEHLGLVEGVDFTITSNGYAPIAKTKTVISTITIPGIPAVMNGETVLVPATPDTTEEITTTETYYANFPSEQQLLDLHIEFTLANLNKAELITTYIENNRALITENDSINISNGEIITWDFANLSKPTNAQLYALIQSNANRLNKQQILKQIQDLENQLTPRRLREAIVTGNHNFVLSIESQIATLRQQLG